MKSKDVSKTGRERSLANLRPAKQGEPSRNPKGRPLKINRIPDILGALGLERIEDADLPAADLKLLRRLGKKSMLEAVLRLVYLFALRGNSWAVQFIADRTEGPCKQTFNFIDIEAVQLKINLTAENAPEPTTGETPD